MGDIYVMKADVTQQMPLTTRSGIDNQWPAWQARRQSEAWWVRFRQEMVEKRRIPRYVS
jgi:hypothetical protein